MKILIDISFPDFNLFGGSKPKPSEATPEAQPAQTATFPIAIGKAILGLAVLAGLAAACYFGIHGTMQLVSHNEPFLLCFATGGLSLIAGGGVITGLYAFDRFKMLYNSDQNKEDVKKFFKYAVAYPYVALSKTLSVAKTAGIGKLLSKFF